MMAKETDFLVQSLFERESLQELTLDELKGMTTSYPYSSILHFLYSKKLKKSLHHSYREAASHTALFYNQPQWLYYLLNDDAEIGTFKSNPSPELLQSLAQEEEEMENKMEVGTQDQVVEEHVSIPIEPFHTVDYFASQGIKLSKEEQKDELYKKVQSFTAWLRTMKRLQPAPETTTYKNIEEIFGDTKEQIEIDKNEVFTEAMAEVYLKQGMREKAIEIYQKLSLQNPANHITFADKIQQIKENKI